MIDEIAAEMVTNPIRDRNADDKANIIDDDSPQSPKPKGRDNIQSSGKITERDFTANRTTIPTAARMILDG